MDTTRILFKHKGKTIGFDKMSGVIVDIRENARVDVINKNRGLGVKDTHFNNVATQSYLVKLDEEYRSKDNPDEEIPFELINQNADFREGHRVSLISMFSYDEKLPDDGQIYTDAIDAGAVNHNTSSKYNITNSQYTNNAFLFEGISNVKVLINLLIIVAFVVMGIAYAYYTCDGCNTVYTSSMYNVPTLANSLGKSIYPWAGFGVGLLFSFFQAINRSIRVNQTLTAISVIKNQVFEKILSNAKSK